MANDYKGRGPRVGNDARKSRGLDTQIQDHIGRSLKTVYQQVTNEPVPDKFVELLKQLDKRDGTE